ncbi:MAG: MATE family efflux transporter [Oscillospiraceae bacterium]|nr:MATE family efflux transporter [Oscillospiraceae bacterium]
MNLFVKDKNFYRGLLSIALPVALQQLILFGVSLADTVMVGMLGEVQLSAVSIANQLTFIFILLSFGTGSGASVLAAQYWGRKDVESIQKIMTVMYRIILVAGVFFTLLAVFFPRQVIAVFITDLEVIEEGVKYLRIVGLSYLFMGVSITTIHLIRAVSIVKIALIVSTSSLVICAFLNWVLIFGNLGAPALGVSGAAISTCIARVAEIIIIAVYMIKYDKKIQYRLKMFFTRNLGMARKFLEAGMPVIINELIWGSGMAVIAVIIGRMGREFTAANAICMVLAQLVTIAMFGVANASAVVIGNTVGAGEYEKAKEYARTILAISFLLGLIGCVAVQLLKTPVIGFYNISPLAKEYARQIINVHSVVVIFVALAANMMVGILRGGGDTRFVLVIDIVFMWCICIPLGAVAGLVLGLPVWLVYSILKTDEILKVITALIRVLRGKWINDITIR